MKYDLKTPCDQCPFTTQSKAARVSCQARADEIAQANSFPCHKTVDHIPKDTDQACAGWIAYNLREGTPSQLLRIVCRLGTCTPEDYDLDNPDLIDEPEDMVG